MRGELSFMEFYKRSCSNSKKMEKRFARKLYNYLISYVSIKNKKLQYVKYLFFKILIWTLL